LHVAHLNHWFRGKEAREDAEFVREIAHQWGLSCAVETFDVPNYARKHKLSDEDAARRVRYSFLAAIARQRGASVAVAHNADDQVETVLMSILRGTGTSGLAGMQMLASVPLTDSDETMAAFGPVEAQSDIPLYRPLLYVWRHQIVEYCKQEGLQPRFDSTNWERTYRRNRIRHDLIPLLQMQYSLAVKDHLFNLARIASAEDELVEGIVDDEWQRIAVVSGDKVSFESRLFAMLPEAMRRRLVRRAITTVAGTLHDITFEHVESAVAIIADRHDSPRAQHLPHGLIVSRERGWGNISRRGEHDGLSTFEAANKVRPLMTPGDFLPVHIGSQVPLDGDWRFQAAILATDAPPTQPGDLVALFDMDVLAVGGQLALRTRAPGDYIQPLGMGGRKSLQDLMVDAKIPRELRDSIPVLAFDRGHEVLWVPGPGGRRSRHAPVTKGTKQVLQLCFVRKQP
jgi:tRNA(Ile)-lysidine synthase